MKETMKAFRVNVPLKMELEEVPIPTPNDDELLVKVKAVGICSTDVELYDGSMPYYREGLSKMPIIIGHEWSGTVAAFGKNVKGFEISDLVVGDISIGCGKCQNCLKGLYHLCTDRTELGVIRYDGAFAEYMKTKGKNVYKVPAGIAAEDAALTEPAATALYGVHKAQPEPGDRVAVFGDGSIGMLTAQIAGYSGASKVAVIARKDMHKDLIESWGLVHVHYIQGNLNQMVENALGGPVDVVFEATGNANVYNDAIYLVRPGGKICAMSITGQHKIEADLDYMVTRDVTMIGMLASTNSFAPTLAMIAAGKIDVGSCITHRFKFEESVEAWSLCVRMWQRTVLK